MNTLEIYLHPDIGLCNRLWVVFSYYNYAKSTNKQIKIHWPETICCPDHFLNFFEPLERIEFVSDVKINTYTTLWQEQFNPYETFIYQDLKLKGDIKNIINKKINMHKNYNAIHVRTTRDFITYLKTINKKPTTFNRFDLFLEKNSENQCYISTDQVETQKYFTTKYNHVYFNSLLKEQNCDLDIQTRYSSIQDAVIDLFVCTKSKLFLGTPVSTFSDTIIQLRKNKYNL